MTCPPNSTAIFLLTDFGLIDPYVSMMKSAILKISPHVSIIDISHNIRPQDIRQAAFLLDVSVPFLPDNSVAISVVDPGVGTERKPVALRIGKHWFIGPDNGLLFPIWHKHSSPESAMYVLDQPNYWMQDISNTFHGRDIFAPVAAHIINGINIKDLGSPLSELVELATRAPTQLSDTSWRLTVEHIDHFGNLITNLPSKALPPDIGNIAFTVGETRINGISSTYAAANKLIALVGSLGFVEIAYPDGSAAAITGLSPGDSIFMSS
jgi:hypothetical protein